MYLLLIVLPLFSFFSGCIGGRWCGHKGVSILSLTFLGGALALSLVGIYECCLSGAPLQIALGVWFKIVGLSLYWRFYFDTLTLIMLGLVFFISFGVHMYSLDYMEGDPHLCRFIALLSLFTFFMVILVSGDTILQIFVGWEGVGVVSYLLVNFWFTRASANRGALMALLTNRVGDWGYTLGALGLLTYLCTLELGVVCGVSPYLNNDLVFITVVLFTIGVMGKSAQLGLHTWLPHAMEGPTPVSALLHAATLVTAGVFLLLRLAPLHGLSSASGELLMVLGGATAFLGGTCGLVANDIKRIIAFSTCSQLGYMIYGIGAGAYALTASHLVNHAFFKALLFLSAGGVIHALGDEQDLRRMGGLRKPLTFLYTLMLIGSVSLMGVPFTTGFYSKETLLSFGAFNESMYSGIGFILCIISAGATTLYSVRILSGGFLTPYRGSYYSAKGVYEPRKLIIIPLTLLGVFSLVWGYISINYMTYGALGISPYAFHQNFDFRGGGANALALTFLMLLTGVGFITFLPKSVGALLFKTPFKWAYCLLSNRYFFDLAYNKGITKAVLKCGTLSGLELDKGIGEVLGPLGANNGVKWIGFNTYPNLKGEGGSIFYGQMLICGLLLLIIAIYSY